MLWPCFIIVSHVSTRYSVGVGNIDRNFNNGGELIGVSQIIIHEDYTVSSSPYYVDMALLRLSRSINYNDRTRPICLAHQREGLRNCYVTGWGTSHYEGTSSEFWYNFDVCKDSICKFYNVYLAHLKYIYKGAFLIKSFPLAVSILSIFYMFYSTR